MTDANLTVAELADYNGAHGLTMADSTDALRYLFSTLSTALQTFASLRRYRVVDFPPAELERCYRAYAARLNQTRRWRKVSWRRLNRPQRAAAWRLWQAQATTGCLPAQA